MRNSAGTHFPEDLSIGSMRDLVGRMSNKIIRSRSAYLGECYRKGATAILSNWQVSIFIMSLEKSKIHIT